MTEYIVRYENEYLQLLPDKMQELIRCKDCKHGEPGACGDGVDCDGVWHDAYWFCADGERKEVK